MGTIKHGSRRDVRCDPALRLEEHIDEAKEILGALSEAGIDLDAVTQRLEDKGVRKFIEAYDRLLQVIARRRELALRDTTAGPGSS